MTKMSRRLMVFRKGGDEALSGELQLPDQLRRGRFPFATIALARAA